jgi:hypothetical protein
MNETIQTEIMPSTDERDRLSIVVTESGLEPESANALRTAFAPMFDEAEKWRKQVATISVTSVDQVREMKLAREVRLALREIRIRAESKRKQLKEDVNRRGKAIDGACNVLKFLIEPLEEQLLAQEQFAEREAERLKQALKAKREEMLKVYGVDTSFYNLAEMPDPAFDQLLANTQLAHENQQKALREAEEKRLEAERLKAAEQERLRLENERLKAERDQLEAKAREDAEKARIEREAQEAKAKAERDALEEKNRAERAEQERKFNELKEQTRKEREAAEAEARAAAVQQKKLADAVAAANKAREQEAIAQQIAASKAAAAPDRDKILAFAQTVRALKVPACTTTTGIAAQKHVEAQVEKCALWIENRTKEI